MLTAILILLGLGTALSAVGMIRSGQAQEKAAEYNAQVAERQATVATQKAAYEEEMRREKGRKLSASQRAAAGATGVTMESFSDIFAQTALDTELDALAIRYGGDIGSSMYRSEAVGQRFTGTQAKKAGTISAGATLLTGAGKAIGVYQSGLNKPREYEITR